MTGTVFFVGAGPGAADLLTLRAARILGDADVVMHDDIVPADVAAMFSRAATVLNVGKRCGEKLCTQREINDMMIDYARQGLLVVRLKSGDPAVFGRLGEELRALRKAQIPFEIIPGVSSALAAAAAARISLTERNVASRVVFATASLAGNRRADWIEVLTDGSTLAIYMPGRDWSALSRDLIASGIRSCVPCCVVSRAGAPDEQVLFMTVGALRDAAQVPTPAMLIVGDVIAAAADADAAPAFSTLALPTSHRADAVLHRFEPQ